MTGKRIYLRLLLLGLFVLSLPVAAGTPLPEDRGAAGLWQTLGQLQTTASAIHITAHPDDEDGPMLTLLARGRGVRTMLLTLNRGEGGANLINPFFFDALGVLRSLELLQSDRYYGVKQFHTRVVDYGYSKTLEEALTKWGGRENVLRDVVRVVRRERPDVIIARFRGNRYDGHGNHQTAGLMAQDVFEAAADPNRFPEQIAEGLRPWRPKKLYMNNIRPNSRPEDKGNWTLVVNSGEYDPLLGRSYHQISRQGLGYQRSQGTAGRAAPAGPYQTYYKLLKAAQPSYNPEREESFFDGLDTTISGIGANASPNPPAWLTSGLEQISKAVEAAVEAFDPVRLEATVPNLVDGLKAVRALQSRAKNSSIEDAGRDRILFLLNVKEKQFQKALRQALALDLEVKVLPEELPTGPFAAFRTVDTITHAIPGESFWAGVRLVNRSRVEVIPTAVEIRAPEDWQATAEEMELKPLGYNDVLTTRFRVQVPEDAEPTRPHWQRTSINEAIYEIKVPKYHTYPFPPPPAWGWVRLEVMGTPIEIKDTVRIMKRDPSYGALTPPLVVVPAISVRFASEHGIIPLGQRDYKVSVGVHSSVKGPAEGTLRLRLPAGWRSTPESATFSFAKEDEEDTYDFTLSVPADLREQAYTLEVVASYGGREYSEGYINVTARDVSRFNLYRAAQHQVRGVDVMVAENLRLGYVMGSGDEIPQTLGLLGLRPDMLGPADLATADLDQYDAVILGVRAYAVRPDVKTYNGRLLDYVKNGGVLIVQYQTPEFDNNYGPYPYTQSNRPEEVSEEDSPITILAPENLLFNHPNKITPKDFAGWVEQRGSKFLKTWDERYTPLVQTYDKGQEPQRGGWLYARYGKGVYIYSAYAWYRQLPYAVPGAFRLYANMISLRRTLAEQGERA
ncbi:MAG: PIG-L family deacetylase, partial [Terriglobia bacterium]